MYRDFNDYEIIYIISENNSDTFKILYEKYQPLIYKIVSEYQNTFKKYGYDIDDLMQLGYIALYKSSHYYNEDKSSRFITYLKTIIRNTLLNEIKNNSTNKRIVLNNAISYDKQDNNEYSYLDYIKDNRDYFSYEEEKNKFIYFKNTLDYNNAGIFEMFYNGYTITEISKMFCEKPKVIIHQLHKIKKKYQNDI